MGGNPGASTTDGNGPAFELWLEFEHTQPNPGDDPTDDFANISVTLPDGRRYALNVWTFRFIHRARFPWPHEITTDMPEECVVAPDLFVERLDRPTLERVIREMLVQGEMEPKWLCPADDEVSDSRPPAERYKQTGFSD